MKIKLTSVFFLPQKEILHIARMLLCLFSITFFSFNPDNICSQHDAKITIDADKKTIYEHLEENHSNRYCNFELLDDIIILIKRKTVNEVQQDPIRVSGKVTDGQGTPLPGKTVRISGTNRGTATNFDGDYTFILPSSASVLIFISIGFAAKEIVVGDQTTLDDHAASGKPVKRSGAKCGLLQCYGTRENGEHFLNRSKDYSTTACFQPLDGHAGTYGGRNLTRWWDSR